MKYVVCMRGSEVKNHQTHELSAYETATLIICGSQHAVCGVVLLNYARIIFRLLIAHKHGLSFQYEGPAL